jgi:type II secretory pathway pseudopilin PulG
MGNRKGLTVLELLVSVGLLSLLFTMMVPGMQSFFARMEMHAALRTVTAALSTARYTAILDNQPVRAEVVPGCLRLSRDGGHGWQVFRSFELSGKLSVFANGQPVFSPLGNVSPLCTITLRQERRVCRVVLSMYGRLKVYDNG